MQRSFLRRGLALALVGLWTVPAAGALVIGLHIAEHHRYGGEDHHRSQLVEELSVAAVHGHHHSAVVPEHDHPLAVNKVADSLPVPVLAASVAQTGIDRLGSDQDRSPEALSRGTPPDALFYTHCSLLL